VPIGQPSDTLKAFNKIRVRLLPAGSTVSGTLFRRPPRPDDPRRIFGALGLWACTPLPSSYFQLNRGLYSTGTFVITWALWSPQPIQEIFSTVIRRMQYRTYDKLDKYFLCTSVLGGKTRGTFSIGRRSPKITELSSG
jgi:hypothetical protein